MTKTIGGLHSNKQKYLSLSQLVDLLVKQRVLDKEVARALMTKHSYRSNALEEEGIPTSLLFDLIKLTGRKLRVYSSTDYTIYWLE
ncbi:hypothetical protein [Enterococcus mundtii]|uniref:hypothetical protein n=2 Tax=Enterococcus mundtii TaxID=53346 RepID=UPI0003371E18|nr:hypothetical protein [Enterococcus mundtii]EOU09341.1 hypothetical protein I587_02951 [Enterococcus mundtii ATCC 882]